ncbi:MAG: metallophosphoesterase family protein [Propylenella sp.]
MSESGRLPVRLWGRRFLRRLAAQPSETPRASEQNSAPHTASAPEGLRIYAFGDVHGRSDLLRLLRGEIDRGIGERAPRKAIVIGLGDYIDRGPDSSGVIDLLLEGFGAGVEHVFLRGNHEDLLLRFLDRPERVGRSWFRLGGLDLVRSYGVDIRPYAGADPDLRAAREELALRLPGRHLAFIQSLPISHILGDYLFVHAGVRIGIPFGKQASEDMLWVRDGFSDRDESFEKIVVHGHTPTEEPFLGRYRINVDTAAYATSRLTCVVLEGTGRQVLQVGRPSDERFSSFGQRKRP